MVINALLGEGGGEDPIEREPSVGLIKRKKRGKVGG